MTDNNQNNNNLKPVWACCKETVTSPSLDGKSTGKRSVIQSSIALTVALVLLFLFKKPVMAGIVTGISATVLICGLFIPSAFLAIEKLGLKLGEWVATGLTWLLLVPFFYICFVPGRIVMTLQGKDPLNLNFSAKVQTYWVPRKPVTDIGRYQKQH
jgi:hypothetical protein